MQVYIDIFMAFLRPGVLTFGGGPSAIPLMQQEVVNNYGWMSVEEFTDALALGNALPGPIATKMSALVGYKVCGWAGAMIGLFATVAPTVIAIILLLNIYLAYKNAAWLKGMMLAVRPVVVILILETVITMGQKSFPGMVNWIIAGVAAVGIFYLKINPAILIVASLAFGGFFLK